MSQAPENKTDSLDLFERKFVFRTARGYFVFLAIVAILIFTVGVSFGARAVATIEPAEPSEPVLPQPPPEPPALTLTEVEGWMHKQETAPSTVTANDDPKWVATVRDNADDVAEDPEQVRFNKLLADFQALFPEPQYSWKDAYSRHCARTSPYGCLRYERTLDQEGVSGILEQAIKAELQSDSFDQLNPILQALVSVLTNAPVDRRAALIGPTAEAFRELQGGYRRSVYEHSLAVQQLQEEYENKLREHEETLAVLRAEKEDNTMKGIQGVLAGLGLLVLVSVFLAHFAIERHLRLVREALMSMGKA